MMSILIWLHLLAAISWIGGMMFLSLVLAPLVRSRKAAPEFMALFRSAALRFRLVVWSAIAVLLTTGPVLLLNRGLSLLDVTGWPAILIVKLSLVGLLLLLTVLHDLLLGPRVSQISVTPAAARTAWEQILVRTARWVPRLSLLVAVALLFAAVLLARS